MSEEFKQKHTDEEHGTSLAHFCPRGLLFSRVFDETSQLKKLLNGFGGELRRAEVAVNECYEQHDINKTVLLLEEWERAVGIPDDCFTTDAPLDVRRGQVIIKLANNPQKALDFERLADLLGFEDVTVRPLNYDYYLPHNVPFFLHNGPKSHFIVVVQGTGVVASLPPYNVPFGIKSGASLIQCVFDALKPANVLFIYVEGT